MQYFDLHCDSLYEAVTKEKDLVENDMHVSFQRGADIPHGYSVWLSGFPITCAGRQRSIL